MVSRAEIMKVFANIAKKGKGASLSSLTGCVGTYRNEQAAFVMDREVMIGALKGKLQSTHQVRFSNASGPDQDRTRLRLSQFLRLARKFSKEWVEDPCEGKINCHSRLVRHHGLDPERMNTKRGFVNCISSNEFKSMRQEWMDEDKALGISIQNIPAGVPVYVPPVVTQGVAVPPVALATVPIEAPVNQSPPPPPPPPPTPVNTSRPPPSPTAPVNIPSVASAPAPAPDTSPLPKTAAKPAKSSNTSDLCTRILVAFDKAKFDAKAGRLYFDDGYTSVATTIGEFTISVVKRGAKGGNVNVYDGYVDRPASAVYKKRVHLRSKPEICRFFGV
ncbi:MAG: hypothetical protein CMI16_05800 [Opitutaceae bacterium]|nr:hypothetical protein [Opitutaceae bacterium]